MLNYFAVLKPYSVRIFFASSEFFSHSLNFFAVSEEEPVLLSAAGYSLRSTSVSSTEPRLTPFFLAAARSVV